MDSFPQDREREKCRLVVEGLRLSGDVRFRAAGVSMLPTLIPGDFVRVESAALADIALGDVVLHRRGDSLFLHRVIELRPGSVQTRGDSMVSPDPVSDGELLGKLVSIERNGETKSVSSRLSPFSKILGKVLCYSPRLRSLFLAWNSRPVGWRSSHPIPANRRFHS